MTTISVTEDVKRRLLRVTSELQLKLKRRVDFNEAIRFLLVQRRERRPRLLMEACKPTIGADEALKELTKERKRDEERAERYFSL